MYLIIDREYRIYQSPELSGYVRGQCKRGNLSVVRLYSDHSKDGLLAIRRSQKAEGMNLDGSYSEIQQWLPEFKVADH